MKTVLAVFILVALTATSHAGSPRRAARTTSGGEPSPVLTSVIELEATHESDILELRATGLTARGERASVTEEHYCDREEQHHLKWMTDYRDGYWDACYRLVLEVDGKSYIAGYEVDSGDRDPDHTDFDASSEVNVPFDFDVKTQTFQIRTDRMAPLPVRFRQKSFAGVRFLVPVNLRGFSKQEVEVLIRGRGGEVVDAAGPLLAMDFVFIRLTHDLACAIEPWFDDPDTLRSLGGRQWVHNASVAFGLTRLSRSGVP